MIAVAITHRLNSKALQVKASYLNLVKTQSAAVTAYQNYCFPFFFLSRIVSALSLLATHTPTLSPLELSQCVSRWNLHSPEKQSDSFITTPIVSSEELSVSPADLLLNYDERIYRLSNIYRRDNSAYLRRILKDIGMNEYSVLHVGTRRRDNA